MNKSILGKFMYNEDVVKPMRQELVTLGFKELLTAQDAEKALKDNSDTTLLVVNSVCGCAARNARPAVKLALMNEKKPKNLVTTFAGQEKEATDAARSFLVNIPPSSPAIALLKDGKVACMLNRQDIEGRTAEEISEDLVTAFNNFC